MINAIPHPTQTQTAPQRSTVRQTAPQLKPQPTPTDTVQLSAAALSARAIIQEAAENHGQTAREAATGDVQARNLLARESAAK
jgi:hypothetical protein